MTTNRPICTAAGLDVPPTPDALAAMAELVVRAWGDRTAEPTDLTASVADAGAQLARAVPLLLARLAELEAAQGTAYRASRGSIVMGLYTTAPEARKHREARERRSWPAGTNLSLDRWVEDEEDGVAELVAVDEVYGETKTGYVVTALEIASVYDEEADA